MCSVNLKEGGGPLKMMIRRGVVAAAGRGMWLEGGRAAPIAARQHPREAGAPSHVTPRQALPGLHSPAAWQPAPAGCQHHRLTATALPCLHLPAACTGSSPTRAPTAAAPGATAPRCSPRCRVCALPAPRPGRLRCKGVVPAKQWVHLLVAFKKRKMLAVKLCPASTLPTPSTLPATTTTTTARPNTCLRPVVPRSACLPAEALHRVGVRYTWPATADGRQADSHVAASSDEAAAAANTAVLL